MDRPPINPKPVVEPGADELEHGELTTHALRVRIRQQEILAELGVLALQARPFLELLNETSRLTAEGMGPARWQSCSHIAVIADHTGSKVPLEEPSFRRGFFSSCGEVSVVLLISARACSASTTAYRRVRQG